MKSSTQVLAILLADLHADISKAQASVDALLAQEQATPDRPTGPLPPLQDTQEPCEGETAENGCQRVLGQWTNDRLPPGIMDVGSAVFKAPYYDGTLKTLTYIRESINEAAQIFDHHWRMNSIRADGSMQQYNAVLTMALGPDAPQFVARGDGWALVTMEGNDGDLD